MSVTEIISYIDHAVRAYPEIKDGLYGSSSLRGESQLSSSRRGDGALLFVGAGVVAIAAAIAAVLTTAVVYTNVAFWGSSSGEASLSSVDDLSADIAESLVNVEAIEEEDVETVREAVETSIINSMSK